MIKIISRRWAVRWELEYGVLDLEVFLRGLHMTDPFLNSALSSPAGCEKPHIILSSLNL